MPDITKKPLSEVVDMYFQGKRGMISSSTVERYRCTTNDFTDFLGDAPFGEVTSSDWLRWRGGLFDRGLTRATVDSYIRVVRQFYNWLEGHRLVTPEENLGRYLQKPKLERGQPKAIRTDDVLKVLVYLAKVERSGLEPAALITRDRAMILFLADTGCRSGGLVSLNKEALDMKARRAIVAEKGKGGKKHRLVFFGERTQAALKDWLYFHPAGWQEAGPETPLFVSVALNQSVGERITTSGVYQMLKYRSKDVGIEGRFNPHAFRHGAAREWLRNGADLATVAQLLGHTTVAVTERHYAVWAQEELAIRHRRVAYVDGLKNGSHRVDHPNGEKRS